MDTTLAFTATALAALAATAPRAWQRLELSRAKHPSLTGHARWAQRMAGWLPGFAYGDDRFFDCDAAPPEVAQRRRAGLQALSASFAERFARSLAVTQEAAPLLPDLQFTGRYRVPFPFTDLLRQYLRVGAFVQAADGVTITDLDGHRLYDLTGSYGVNLFGTDFYKACIRRAVEDAEPLGPVLGNLHPSVLDNARRLCRLSGMDAVTFHMSGTEAVMQAVRLARYHTGRSHLVRFCGAYHGWWEDVQPGPGNPMPPRETYTLRDMHERSLKVLRTRNDIACVLVNPLQALHPNQAAPGDSSLIDGSRPAGFDRAAYTTWLRQLRGICTQRGIVLIFDEVFLGFRLAPGGAQAYFGVEADMVTYGKTLGGGLPVGVVCGKAGWMKRYREDRPADICFARGTFNAHPYVMTAMSAFLDRLEDPDVVAMYEGLDERWDARARRFNARMADEGLPMRAAHLSSVWTIRFETTSRYHWLLQFYLRAQGLALSWVGTGRLIFSLNYTDADFDHVLERFVMAGRQMQADGWWWQSPGLDGRSVRRTMLREALARRLALR